MKKTADIKTAKELNTVLLDVLVALKNGELEAEVAKGIATLADKVNKNNLNTLHYKKMTNQPTVIEFFE